MDRSKMVRRAVCRWIAANLEESKSGNIDQLDLIDKFQDHANSQLGGLRVRNQQLVGFLEEQFRGVKYDEPSGRINGIIWRKPKEVKWVEKPSKSKEDSALETRLLTFLRQGNVFVARGGAGFSTAAFANWRDSWFYGGFAHIRHDRIDPEEAQSWLESRHDLVELRDDGLWYVTVAH